MRGGRREIQHSSILMFSVEVIKTLESIIYIQYFHRLKISSYLVSLMFISSLDILHQLCSLSFFILQCSPSLGPQCVNLHQLQRHLLQLTLLLFQCCFSVAERCCLLSKQWLQNFNFLCNTRISRWFCNTLCAYIYSGTGRTSIDV